MFHPHILFILFYLSFDRLKCDFHATMTCCYVRLHVLANVIDLSTRQSLPLKDHLDCGVCVPKWFGYIMALVYTPETVTSSASTSFRKNSPLIFWQD